MGTIIRSLTHPKDEIVEFIERIYRYRMTTTSGGNLSIKDDGGAIWITPARVDKGNLRREDIIRVGPDGVVQGLHKPSSEYPFHAAIYKARPDIRAIVHAHPVALVSFSICRQIPNTALFRQAAQVCGKVDFAPYELPGSQALGESIATVFKKGADSVILENHGVVTGGTTLLDAFQRFETLEFTAKTLIKARALGPIHYLTPDQIDWFRRPRPPMPEADHGPATSAERAARRDIMDFVRRGYRQRLMTSTEGTLSARVGEHAFVITNYGIDRGGIDLDQMTLIKNGQRQTGSRPSRSTRVHHAIYEQHPAVKAIVIAMPVNATAFSVTKVPLDSRTIPESYIFLRDVPLIPFGLQYEDGAQLAAMLSPQQPVALVENDGCLVLGTSVLDVFDRLEVLESTAEALINARAIGPLCPIGEERIEELVKAFLNP